MIYGYARISSIGQNLERQIKQLKEYGCEYIFEEQTSGASIDRPQLQNLLQQLSPNDEIVITDLTRITRSTQDLFELVEKIKEKGASIRSIKDTWLDTSSNNPYSTFLLTVMGGVNQLERDLIKMRQKEGIEIAKQKGKYKGRMKKYTQNHPGMNHAIELYIEGTKTVNEICRITKVGRSSLYREIEEKNITR